MRKPQPLFKRVLEGRERVFGPDHPHTLVGVQTLAGLAFAQGDFVQAVEFGRRSTAGLAKLTLRGVQEGGVGGKKKTEAERVSVQFWDLVKSAYRLAPEGTRTGGAPHGGDV